MTYPLLRISKDYAHVEVRKGKGAQSWDQMTQVFSGTAAKGKEWKDGEGVKLSARHCLWPSDPNSTLSLPYTVSGIDGLGTGKPELLVFPTPLSNFFAEMDGPPRLVLHEDPRSGNCYKIRLTAALLGLPLERKHYDIMKGETRTPEFLSKVNSNGRIPVLQIGAGKTGRFLPESNAACFYLGEGTRLVPDDRFARADMLRWMFFEQYNHEPNIATLRFWLYYVGEANLSDEQRGLIASKRRAGEDTLELMDQHLSTQDWFAGNAISLADIVLYAYTHVAEMGGFGLAAHAHLCAWLDRVADQPLFVPMD